MIGWKCFDKDLKCRGMQFEVGSTYVHDGKLQLCHSGFHFHHQGGDLFNYYRNEIGTRVCEVEAEDVISEGDKSVCSKMTVKRELSYNEICLTLGSGSGSGSGYGYGSGYGSGSGSGDGSGSGYGYGSGYGDGDGKYYLKLSTNGRISA